MLPHTGFLVTIVCLPLFSPLIGFVFAFARFMVSYHIVLGRLLYREVVNGERAIVPGQQH